MGMRPSARAVRSTVADPVGPSPILATERPGEGTPATIRMPWLRHETELPGLSAFAGQTRGSPAVKRAGGCMAGLANAPGDIASAETRTSSSVRRKATTVTG